MKIVWSPLAIERIREIAVYINTVFKTVQKLHKFPNIGRIVPEVNRNEIQEIIYKNYRIIYRLEKNRISILTVRHGKQIPPEEELSSY